MEHDFRAIGGPVMAFQESQSLNCRIRFLRNGLRDREKNFEDDAIQIE
jgi:hypothetical protein